MIGNFRFGPLLMGLVFAVPIWPTAAEEITIKDLDDVISEIPGDSGKVLTRSVSKVKGFYRGKRLVLLEHRKKTTLNTEEGKKEAESTFYFVVANDRKVARIKKPSFELSSVMSPWPIEIVLVNHRENGFGSGHCNISIPAMGFFESLGFEEGELLPLQSGERFEAFKAGMLKVAKEYLDPNRPD